jgi:hypothetical protein
VTWLDNEGVPRLKGHSWAFVLPRQLQGAPQEAGRSHEAAAAGGSMRLDITHEAGASAPGRASVQEPKATKKGLRRSGLL